MLLINININDATVLFKCFPYQDPETGAANWNAAIIIYMIHTWHVKMSIVKKGLLQSLWCNCPLEVLSEFLATVNHMNATVTSHLPAQHFIVWFSYPEHMFVLSFNLLSNNKINVFKLCEYVKSAVMTW